MRSESATSGPEIGENDEKGVEGKEINFEHRTLDH